MTCSFGSTSERLHLKKIFIIVPLVFALDVLSQSALAQTPPAPPAPPTPPANPTPPAPPPPKTSAVEKGALTIVTDRSGRIASSKKTIVRFELEAFNGAVTVVKVVALPGPVKAGAIIAELSGKDFEKTLADLRTQVAESVERLASQVEEQLVARAADATALERAQRSLFLAEQKQKLSREYYFARDLDMASLRLKSKTDSLKDQGDELTQLERMYSDATLESETKDIVIGRARRAMERGQTMFKYGTKDYELFLAIQHPNDVVELDDNVKYAQQALEHLRIRQRLQAISARLTMAATERALEDAKLKLTRMENDAKAMTVKAPVDGLMSINVPDAGESVNPRSLMATIVDPSALEIGGTLDANSLRVLEMGSKVDVWIPSRPEFSGTATVDEIAPIGAPDGEGASYPYVANVRTSDGMWPLGAEAHIVARKIIPDCILVDSKAVKAEKGKWTVNLWIDGKKVEREIRVGASDGKKTQVISGLAVGDQVVMSDG
jgi:multidrug resistance efflux pump